MAKESKKQIKAQAINEISKKYSKKIKELEEDKRRAIDSWSRLVEKNSILQAENLKLKEQLEKYEDWNHRLQEFMDMDPDSREEVITQYRTSKELNDRFSNILNMYERMFGMF